MRLLLGKLDYDFDRPIVGKLARPADNVFVHFFIEVLLPEWEGVEGLEELPNLADARIRRRIVSTTSKGI